MSIKNWNAGIIRPVAVAPAGPYQDGAAPGVWTLDQAAFWQKQGLWPIAGNAAPYALFGGGSATAINKINIDILSNAVSFGNLSYSDVNRLMACSSNTRSIWASGLSDVATIVYKEFSSSGNTTSFGSLTQACYNGAASSSNTRGVLNLGYSTASGVSLANIDYITIASTGNALNFGNLTVARGANRLTSCASSTRAVWAGGNSGSASNVIDYVTIASTGNATDFGDLTYARGNLYGLASSTRGVFAGGFSGSYSNAMDYITIASTGNATSFGNLSLAAQYSAAANSTRGLFAGGRTVGSSTVLNTIEYITIASTGNGIDFADLVVTQSFAAACSSATAAVQ